MTEVNDLPIIYCLYCIVVYYEHTLLLLASHSWLLECHAYQRQTFLFQTVLHLISTAHVASMQVK